MEARCRSATNQPVLESDENLSGRRLARAMTESQQVAASTVVGMPIFRQTVRVGCAGWNYPRDGACDSGLGESHLQRYSRVFNCCEINSSFYRPHRRQTWKRWAASVPPDFRFAVKAPRTITHESRLGCDPEMLVAFLVQTSFLREKLGPLLFQLPPSLEFDFVLTQKFLGLLREHHAGHVVWEPRHGSWFGAEADDLLRHFQIVRAAADPACVPPAARPGGSAHLAYFRLHGSPRMYYSGYSPDFLNLLAADLQNLAERSAVWCIFDNTAAGHAVQNALELRMKLG